VSGIEVFGAVFGAMFAGHYLGDFWVQSDQHARTKHLATREGRKALAIHVATLTLSQAAFLGLAMLLLGLRLNPLWAVAGLALNAATHAVADMRRPLERLADLIGKGGFYRRGDASAAPCGTGAFALDQGAHLPILVVASMLMSIP